MKFLKTTVAVCLCLGFLGCEKELEQELLQGEFEDVEENHVVEKTSAVPIKAVNPPVSAEIPSFENKEVVSASGSSIGNALKTVKNLFEKEPPVVVQKVEVPKQKLEIKKYELPKTLPTAESCKAKTDIMEQISCYADRATMEKNTEMCDTLEVDGAKFQCYAFYAERAEDEAICKNISIWTHSALKDACIKSVARMKGDSELCRKISAKGINLKDDCFFELYQITLDASLCEKIESDELYLKCAEKPRSATAAPAAVAPEVIAPAPIVEEVVVPVVENESEVAPEQIEAVVEPEITPEEIPAE